MQGNGGTYTNEDFGISLPEANTNVNTAQQTQQNAFGTADASRGGYVDAMGNAQSAGDYLSQAQQGYGTDQQWADYQKARNATLSTQNLINDYRGLAANRGQTTGRAMTNSQMMNAQNNLYGNIANQLQDFTGVSNAAMQDYSTLQDLAYRDATMNYGSEQDRLDRLMGVWGQDSSNAAQRYQEYLSQLGLRDNVYDRMQQGYWNQQQLDYDRWASNLQAELEREKMAAQKYSADAGLRLQQYLKGVQDEAVKAKAAPASLNRNAISAPLGTGGAGAFVNGNRSSDNLQPQVDYVNGVPRYTYVAPAP